MGCPCSKTLTSDALPNPLQQLQAMEAPKRKQKRRRQEAKHQRQLAKLQKRNARKRRNQCGNSNSNGQSVRQSGSHNLAPQLRLVGGSNGSTATECPSALYARTLEQQRDEDKRIIEHKTQQQLERQLHTFLLNQLVLGIQFFGHFEHEMAAIDEQQLAKQRDYAQKLTDHSLLHASAIDAAVAKRLLFKPIDGAQRQLGTQPEPLQKSLTYVVFDNVDVARPNDANYDSIAALCKVLLETDYYNTTPCRSEYVQLMEQSRWMGYVRLKLRETTAMQRSCSSPSSDEVDIDNDAVYTDGSSGYSTGTGTYAAIAKPATISAKCSWDDGDYDHVYITRLNTERSIEELKLMRVTLQSNVLPEACICQLANCLPSWLEQSDDDTNESSSDSDSDSSDKDEQPNKLQLEQQSSNRSGYETVQVLRQCRIEQQRRRALLQQCYLSSQQFMHYFAELLRQQLALELGISAAQLATGSYRGCSIYTRTDELVPAIHVPHAWPDCAFEFNLRTRLQHTNAESGEPYQWPTIPMRKRIQSFGYHVVPVGYAPKRSRNPFRELEWRIQFPQAEQYLERQLSRTQLKVLLMMKALSRTFVTDKCQSLGHIVEQLRTHLFWQCERLGNNWPEEFLGEQLVRFVRSFADCLAKKQLSDYFIERRNLFENVPEDALMELRSIMAGIAEQPLVHVLQALRNLQHHDNFYPKLNYGRVLENLITQDYIQLRSWAKFSRNALPVLELEEQQQQQQPKEHTTDAEGLLGMHLHQERTRGKLRRKTQLLRAQQLQLAEQRSKSVDSTVPDIPLLMPRASQASQSASMEAATTTEPTAPQLNDGIEILRRTNLLELLMDHMLAMLGKANEFRNPFHAQLYLEQAQRLCRLYQQLGCSQNAQHYAEALCQAASSIERANSNSSCSRRNSCNAQNSPRQAKFIQFVEHVVQLHTGELKPLQSPSTPATTTKSTEKLSTPLQPETESSAAVDAAEKAIIGPLGTLLQQLQLDAGALQTIHSKTDQLMQTLAPELKRDELRDMIKRNAQKLKSAFN